MLFFFLYTTRCPPPVGLLCSDEVTPGAGPPALHRTRPLCLVMPTFREDKRPLCLVMTTLREDKRPLCLVMTTLREDKRPLCLVMPTFRGRYPSLLDQNTFVKFPHIGPRGTAINLQMQKVQNRPTLMYSREAEVRTSQLGTWDGCFWITWRFCISSTTTRRPYKTSSFYETLTKHKTQLEQPFECMAKAYWPG